MEDRGIARRFWGITRRFQHEKSWVCRDLGTSPEDTMKTLSKLSIPLERYFLYSWGTGMTKRYHRKFREVVASQSKTHLRQYRIRVITTRYHGGFSKTK